jgi:hypothetical protein
MCKPEHRLFLPLCHFSATPVDAGLPQRVGKLVEGYGSE